MRNRSIFILSLLLLSFIVVACTSTDPIIEERFVEVTRVEIVEVPGDTTEVVVTRVEIVTQVVTATRVVEIPVTLPVQEIEEPVTLAGTSTTDIPTLDPQQAQDSVSINNIESLFVNLTNYDLETAEVVPEAATNWEVSDDGLVYTFDIRTDIPWVYHNPAVNTTEQVIDEDGNPRFVTAHDFVYGIKRACDPTLGSYYSGVVAPLIVGCLNVLNVEDPSDIPQELWDGVGVSAPDDATLIIELEFPASYFLSMTPMWTLSATPEWVIVEYDNAWIEAGNIVTNGRFVLNEWIHNVRRTLVRNPLMPEDMYGSGNIDKLVTTVVPDATTSYALWLNNDIGTTGIPEAELQGHLDEFSDETVQIPNLVVDYFAFRTTKAPFDNVHVRRAFSATFDRQTYVTEVRQGQGLPMTHFAPPGIFGAPPINEVGISYDPDFARAEMEAAGYPNCEGFPAITLTSYTGDATRNRIEFFQAALETELGCSPDVIRLEQLPFRELLAAYDVSVPDTDAPHMWTGAWGPDYADENNWVGDVLWCDSGTATKRACSEVDDLILEARSEPDQSRRVELYREVEEGLFGAEGEVPLMPILLRLNFQAVHSWYDFTPALFGGGQFYNHSIDVDAQQAAMDE